MSNYKLPDGISAFTIIQNGIGNKLMSNVTIQSEDRHIDVMALWDTGATISCISHDVVDKLGLIPCGITPILTPSGGKECNQYLISTITLPNNVILKDVPVCDSEIGGQGFGFLIGMNIITLGDFAICNSSGKTSFTFRMPAVQGHRIDFVKQINVSNCIGRPNSNRKSTKHR